MERLYCTINEEQARIAHDMMSMSDYKVGSKTEEYRGYVDKAYDLAEKVAEARPRKRIELKHWQRDIQREWPST